MPEALSIINREQEVLSLYAQGLTSKEIASSLFISPHTVEAHKRKMMYKCRAKNLAEPTVMALRAGTIT
jgi:DNA-binding CsgD family transcriptional regulator